MATTRLHFKDLLSSRLPNILGLCGLDWARVAEAVNSAQERLLTCREVGDEGWYGTYAEMAFNVTRNSPYITLPRGVARLISVDACTHPISIRNQFYEYMEFGDGRLPKTICDGSGVCVGGNVQSLRRNIVATFLDIVTSGKGLRVYVTEPADAGGTNRVFIGGRDANGQKIQTLDGPLQVAGVFTTLQTPFADVMLPLTVTGLEISAIDTVMKDVTIGPVSFYEVDLTTGAQRLILTMEPGETNAAYSCYYFDSLPRGCCNTPGATDDALVQVTAMVKLDLVPVRVDSDALLIQSKEAIIAECQSVRYADMDSPTAKVQSEERHRAAIRYLNGQLSHFEGKRTPAIEFAPFGSARLANQAIGSLT